MGVAKNAKKDDLPLKVYAKEEASQSPLTGYIKKGNWYYKAGTKGVGVNISAKKLNAYFEELLKQFEYNKKYKEKLRTILVKKLKEKLQSQIEDSIQLKKKLTELENQLEKIEERFILDEIKAPLYEKYKDKYATQIREIRAELEKNSFDSSNLELAVKKMLAIAESLSQTWVLADYDEKQKLQYLIFPEGILYNKEKDRVRTKRVNSLFAEIPLLTRDLEEKKKTILKRIASNLILCPGPDSNQGIFLHSPENLLVAVRSCFLVRI